MAHCSVVTVGTRAKLLYMYQLWDILTTSWVRILKHLQHQSPRPVVEVEKNFIIPRFYYIFYHALGFAATCVMHAMG
jgi:hypothetical protein